MKTSRIYQWCIAIALAALATAAIADKVAAAPPEVADVNEGVEVLTRGPVHEAFAETVTFDPEPGIVAPEVPPDAIEELPPDQKPEGDNVAWIPGYWAWDDERNDFLWVSGIWRALPPGRQWVPGYWSQSTDGVQWISGYWADASASEIEYLPEPPTTVEAGPNIAAPSEDQTWMPGCWIWQQNRYFWRPGYWAAVQPDWDWVPAHYVWAPRGYIYVDGYWDHSVTRRGVLFAPVHFAANVYSRRGFSYSPAVVINPSVFANQLFLRPNYQHYYFGDYYGSNYSSAGYQPWFSYNSSRVGYDPIYAQQRWQNRRDRGWEKNVQANFQNRVRDQHARPRRTWAAEQTLIKKGRTNSGEQHVAMAASLDQLANSQEKTFRFQPINQTQREEYGQQRQGVYKYRDQRQQLETKVPMAAPVSPSQRFEGAKVKLPTSPIMSKQRDQLDKTNAPPKAHQFPQPDPKVAPKARVARSSNQPQQHKVNKVPQTEAVPRGTQKSKQSQVQPKQESTPPAREPKRVTKDQTPGNPGGGVSGNPPGKSNNKPQGIKPTNKPKGGSKEKTKK